MASSKGDALKIAKYMGCSGAHQDANGNWMPCASPETLQRISNEAEDFNPKKRYKSALEDLLEQPHPSRRKRKTKKWERLAERGITGIETLPDGGLVSSPIASSKALPRFRTIAERYDPNAIDGDNDGMVQEGTAFERPKTPTLPSKKPSRSSVVGSRLDGRVTKPARRKITGRMAGTSDEDKEAMRKYRNVLESMTAEDYDSVPDYVEMILGGSNREDLADMYPNLAGLRDDDHAALIRGYILDRNASYSSVIDITEESFDDYSMMSLFTEDELKDWDDYVSSRLFGNMTDDDLDEKYPQFAGLSMEEMMTIQDEIDMAEEAIADEDFLDSLDRINAPKNSPRKPQQPVQMEFDFGTPLSTRSNKGKKKLFGFLRRDKKKPRRYWNSTPYGGDKQLAADQRAQVRKFREYASSNQWNKFHNEHFDWWTFPIDRGSIAYGERYNLAKTNIKKLRNNREFTDSVAEAARLYTLALAWDLDNEEWLDAPDFANGQNPAKAYGTRIWKMARSLQVLGLCKEFNSVQFMVESLRVGRINVGHNSYWENPGPCPDNSRLPVEKKSLNARFDPDAEDGDGDGKVQDNTPFERPVKVTGAMKRAAKELTEAQGDAFEKAMPSFANPEKHISELVVVNNGPDMVTMHTPEIPGLAERFGPDRAKIKDIMGPSEEEGITISDEISKLVSGLSPLTSGWQSEVMRDGSIRVRTADGQDVLTIGKPNSSDTQFSGLRQFGRPMYQFAPVFDQAAREAYIKENPARDHHPATFVQRNGIEFANTQAGRLAQEYADSLARYALAVDEIVQFYEPIFEKIRRELGLGDDVGYIDGPSVSPHPETVRKWMSNPSMLLLSSGAPFETLHDFAHFILGVGFDRHGEWQNGAAISALLGFETARPHVNFIYGAQGWRHKLTLPEDIDFEAFTPTTETLFGWK